MNIVDLMLAQVAASAAVQRSRKISWNI